MNETVDGEYQAAKARNGAYVREKFFGKYPETLEMVSSLSDKDIWRLNRGGHDPHKVYAAYDKATKHQGSPTVIIAKTIKGCLLYTSPSPRDRQKSRMPSSA